MNDNNSALVITLVIVLVLLLVIGPTVVWMLWPLVMVPLFDLPPIGWWQSWGLMILCAILLKSSPMNLKGK